MSTEAPRFVTYCRVSTREQGESGLGLEAQEAAVAGYVQRTGGTVAGAFVEVETGKRSDRPQLAAALALCRKKKAVLLIAKLDRLARKAAFILNLMDSNVDFRAVDCPNDDDMMLGLRAVFAQEEARKISVRTREALAAARARGVKLGCPCPERGSAAGVAAIRLEADRKAGNVEPIIEQIRRAGIESNNGIAQALNARGVGTPRGGSWTATAVRRTLARVG